MALQLSLQRFLADLRFDALFSIHLLELTIFIFQLFQARHQGCIHAAEFGSPFVKAGTAHTVFMTQLRNRNAVLGLLQDRQDLAVGKT